MLEPAKSQRESTERAIWEQLKGRRAEEILGPERKHMASFWATQEEVEKDLKEVNEMDEQAATQYLAEGKSQIEWQSCKMRIN